MISRRSFLKALAVAAVVPLPIPEPFVVTGHITAYFSSHVSPDKRLGVLGYSPSKCRLRYVEKSTFGEHKDIRTLT